MESTLQLPARGDARLVWAQPLVLLLTIPLSGMEMRWLPLPQRFSDFGFGLMSRLGVCFAIVVLVWCWGFTRQLAQWRGPVFLVASVVSANLAFAADRFVSDRWGIWMIVISGAVLLSLSQKLILEYSWVRVLAAAIAAPGFFYLALISSGLWPHSLQRSAENYWPYFWQIGYLLGMFVIPDLFEKDPT